MKAEQLKWHAAAPCCAAGCCRQAALRGRAYCRDLLMAAEPRRGGSGRCWRWRCRLRAVSPDAGVAPAGAGWLLRVGGWEQQASKGENRDRTECGLRPSAAAMSRR